MVKWLIIKYIDKKTAQPTGEIRVWNIYNIEYMHYDKQRSDLTISLTNGVFMSLNINSDNWEEIEQFINTPIQNKTAHTINVEV